MITQPINTGHRAGRMLVGLMESENKQARVVLTTSVFNAEGRRLHQTFKITRWVGRDSIFLTVSLKDGWGAAARVFNYRLLDGRFTFGPAAANPLVAYAAQAALRFAWTGTLPSPKNGRVEVVEESFCGRCGKPLTDPVSIERGVGPECHAKATGSKTIVGQGKAVAA